MKRYWKHLVASTETRVETFLKKQVRDKLRTDCGRMDSEVVEGKQTIYQLTNALCVYFCVDSKYYKSQDVFDAVKLGVSFVERWQRKDGSLDFPTCNFYSAPDTAFCFRRLYGAWKILQKYGATAEEEALRNRYLALLLRCIPIMLYGGFHTPNHRWAVTAALLCMIKLVEQNGEMALETVDFHACTYARTEPVSSVEELCERLRKRAGQYLAEGIDGDADGEYAERSAGNYNAVVDKSLIFAYEMTGDESYLDYVERNLQMMLYYFDMDDTIFTQNSTRQDRGNALYPDHYFYLYTYMANKTGSTVFDAAAHKMISDNLRRGDIAPDCLYIFMLYDGMKNYQFKGYGYLDEYRKFFPGSQVLRVKKASYVYSVLNKQASFLFLKFGSLSIGMRIGESYCDIRNFIPRQMVVTEDGCNLKAAAKGWYYQTFSESQATSDWWEMDHTKRERIVTSHVDITVSIKELKNGLSVTVKAEGLDGLPLRVELDVPSGSVLENDTFCMTAAKGESMVLRNGFLHLKNETQELVIGPGYGTHSFKGHYSGEAKNMDGYSIFLNDYTPYERTFCIVEKR